MSNIVYTIREPLGMHAKQAGGIASLVKGMAGAVTVSKGAKTVSADSIMGIISLNAKCGEEITINFEEGEDQGEIDKIQNFLNENL